MVVIVSPSLGFAIARTSIDCSASLSHQAAELEEYGGSEDMGAESAMDGSECALCTQMVRGEAASPGEAGVWPGGCQRSPTGSEQQARRVRSYCQFINRGTEPLSKSGI